MIISVIKGDIKIKHKVKKDDVFQNFFFEVLRKIKNNDYLHYIDQISSDLHFRKKILKS